MSMATQAGRRRNTPWLGFALSRVDSAFVLVMALASLLALVFAGHPFVYRTLYDVPKAAVSEAQALLKDGFSQYRVAQSCLPEYLQDTCRMQVVLVYEQAQAPNDAKASILVSRYSGQVEVEVNDRFHQVQPVAPQSFRLLNHPPGLIDIPQGVLQSGANRIVLTVTSRSVLGGFLDEVLVGDPTALRAESERILKWTVALPRMLDGALIILALVSAYIGLRHDDRLYMLFSVIAGSFVISTVSPMMPMGTPDGVIQAMNLMRFVGGALILPFLAASSERSSPLSVAALLSLPAFMYLNWALAGSNYEAMVSVRMYWLVTLTLIAIGLGTTFICAFTSREYRHFIVLAAGVFGIFASSTNFLHALGLPVPLAAMVRGYVATAFVLILSVDLIRRFSHNLMAAQAANVDMRREIARVSASLTASHLRAEEARRQLSIQIERQRLMGDLHDGIAGNLITMRALAEHGENGALDEIERLARQALLDLRLVVDSLDNFEGDLAAAIAAFRERIAPQYSVKDLLLTWNVQDAPVLPELSPETNLAIFRILQEAITNARRHTNADTVSVVVRTSRGPAHSARIFVLDNGRSNGFSTARMGFGLKNMRRRARRVGATVRFRFGPHGGVVLLCLPRPQGVAASYPSISVASEHA